MTFYENLQRICSNKNTTPTAVLRDLGVSTSKITRWKNGALPKADMITRLAKALECQSMDFFMDENDLKPITELNDDELFFIRFYRDLQTPDKHRLMVLIYDFAAGISHD